MLEILIREPNENDINFVMNSYLKSLGNQKPYSLLDCNYFNASAHLLANKIMTLSSVLIACQPEDQNQIYGWISADRNNRILFWVYVKNVYRNAGIGTLLMKSVFNEIGKVAPKIKCAHWTASIHWQEENWNLVFDSYPLVKLAKDK